MLKHLDLFSGIGGWTLGFHATEQIETVGFCEIEKYPQQILKQHYPGTPIFEDVRKLDYEQLRTAGLISDTQRIDILTCSYPCQPFSVAGKKRGEEDSRHLWPEVHRLIRDDRIRPMYVLGENVGGHIRLGLDTVSEDMERCGYRWRCFSIEAACIGANHRRQRVWWIAEDVEYTNSFRSHKHKQTEKESSRRRTSSSIDATSNDVADTNDNGHEGRLSKTRDKNVTGQDTQSIRRTDTKDVIRQSNDGGDNQESRANGAVSRSSDDGKTESTRTTGVCGISEESNDHQGTNRKDGLKEDNDRALVQKGQKRVQPSIDRGLGSDQTTLKGTEIQQGTDNDRINRVAESKDVADSNSGHDNAEKKEVRTRRNTFNDGSTGGGTEDVADSKRKPKHNQSNSNNNTKIKKERQETRSTNGSSSGRNVADTNVKRGSRRKTTGQNAEDVGQSSRRAFTRNWDVEPNVGRVANGVPNRVHRLKALGNAIVPQMAYYIGQALLKDFQHKNHN